jgi:hypothetical protein
MRYRKSIILFQCAIILFKKLEIDLGMRLQHTHTYMYMYSLTYSYREGGGEREIEHKEATRSVAYNFMVHDNEC